MSGEIYFQWRYVGCFWFQPPSSFKKDPTVDGAAIRTRSQVPFGDDAQNADFYKTTNQEVYVPQNGKAANSDPGAQGKSSIPLHYYPGMQYLNSQCTKNLLCELNC